MYLRTFYDIYYKHRFAKAYFLKKIILILVLPVEFIINTILQPKKKNLDKLPDNYKEFFNENFEYLFNYFNTDKGSKFIDQYVKLRKRKETFVKGHGYHPFYEFFFKKFKEKKINILEIGAFKGNATAAFYFYFKNSIIDSCDIHPDLFSYSSNRINNFYLDNSSTLDLEKILSKNKTYDVIIEDAGHYLKDQIISLFYLFPILSSNGIFVVEELDFPDTRKDMNIYNEQPTLKEILLNINKKKDFNSKYLPNDKKNYFLNNVKKIEILKGNFNEIAFIEKK